MTWSAPRQRADGSDALRHGFEAAAAARDRFDDGAAWTQRHHDWLGTVTLDWPAAQATLLDARGAIDALAHRREQLEREVVAMLPSSPWVVQVGGCGACAVSTR